MPVLRRALFFVLATFFVLTAPGVQAARELDRETVRPALRGMQWREVGPYRGGRSAAVAGIPQRRDTYYFGGTGGGVWKTEDGGLSWDNVSDGYFGGSIGAVAVSEWDPNVIYVGGGEKTVRGNVSHGDGIWKSTDAGKSWSFSGLADSRHIPRIRIHPKNADHVLACSLGHLFGPNDQRGVYRSTDGGANWKRILSVSDEAGCVDLAMDPTNPRILYASFWRVLRTPYSLESGGEGSGLWKSTDGGDSWTELSKNEGLPEGPLGISGVSVSASNPDNVYAIVEAAEGGVFRSRDGGETWRRTNKQRDLRQRAWYYTRIYADPSNEESVYVLNVRFHHSNDGGKSFRTIGTPHGDNHDLWIDPNDPLRMVQSNDGGANVTTDGGNNWTGQATQPTAQMYRVSVDNDFPYRLLGGQQDNSAVRIRSRSALSGAIGVRDWDPTAGGESGHIVADPTDPDVVYGGSYGGFLTRINHRTGERRAVNVWPDNPMGWGAEELKYRFQWNFPLFFSPHDSRTLYAAANVLFRTTNEGQSWEPISGDLTRDDKSKMGPSGGPITKDNTSVEYYGTIFAAVESPHERGVLWAGSDDGLLHITRDGGKSWKNVTPRSLPAWTMINGIEAHPFEPGGLYVAATRYKLDDFTPYLYRTTDYGKSWKRIDKGIDRLHFTRAIRADPERRGLLYAGTERGVYMSLDDGANWEPLQLNLPVVPITDLAIKDRDLIAATQGRGYWILDDLTPLHQLKPLGDAPARLLTPRPTYRLGGGRSRRVPNMGQNPPGGVVFYYQLDEALGQDVSLQLEILEENGDSIKTFTRKPARKVGERPERGGGENLKQLEAESGMNRFVWNLRYPEAKRFKGMVLWNRNLAGPRAIPGNYRARLTVGEWSEEVRFRLLPDPRSGATAGDFRAQFDFIQGVRDSLNATHERIGKIRTLKGQLKALKGRLKAMDDEQALIEQVTALEEALGEVESTLYQTKMESPQDPLNFPIRLNDKLAGLMGLASIGDAGPTDAMIAVRDELHRAIHDQLQTFERLVDNDLADLNQQLRSRRIDLVYVPEEDDDKPAQDAARASSVTGSPLR